jgi:MipA family protein
MTKFLLTIILTFSSLGLYAKNLQLPLYEMGMVYGMGYLPDYPASDQARVRYIVVPTFLYRGKTLRRDREEGTRATIFKNLNLTMDLSFSGSFPTNATKNNARKGMPDMDWLGEIGPRLQWIYKLKPEIQLRISLPIRSVFTTDFSYTRAVGLNFNPSIGLRINNCLQEKYLCFFSIDSSWVSGGVSDFFYNVQAPYVNEDRPRFNASSGYLSTKIFTGIAARIEKNLSLFTGMGFNSYHQAKNIKSPLYKKDHAYSIFFGLSWFFYQSKELEAAK